MLFGIPGFKVAEQWPMVFRFTKPQDKLQLVELFGSYIISKLNLCESNQHAYDSPATGKP